MYRLLCISAGRLLLAGLCLSLSTLSWGQVSVRSVKVLGTKDVVEIEVEASDRITPQTQVLSGPDRLVVDFPNAFPGNEVRSQSVDRGEVKDVRVGLFQSRPPVTRMVLDLKSAQSYQVFPSGRTVMIKIVGAPAATNASAHIEEVPQPATRPDLIPATYTTHSESIQVESPPPQPPRPALDISYRNGLLGIRSDKATLSEVLYAIQRRTGADIAIPAGAEQEKVVAEIEPAPAPEVLARLLNGSKFNFLILSAPNDPAKLERVILSIRAEGSFAAPLPPAQNNEDSDNDEPGVVQNQPPPPPSATPVENRPGAEANNPPPENASGDPPNQ